MEMPYLVDLVDRTTRVLQDVAWLEESPIEYQILNRNGEILADSHLHQQGEANLYAMGLPSARLVAVSRRGFVEEEHLRRHLQVITAYAQVNVPQPDSPLRWGFLSLTGWLNHSLIHDALIRELARSERDKQ